MADKDRLIAASYPLAKPRTLTHRRIEDVVTLSLDGTVTGFSGRHVEGEDPTESRAFTVKLDAKQLAALLDVIVAEGAKQGQF